MKTSMLIPLLALATLAATAQERLPQWALGEFIRPATDGALISPNSSSTFLCPMRGTRVKWEEGATFNPAAAVKGGKIYILYRAEDNLATGIGVRTSRLGMATTRDGLHLKKRKSPVLYPARDAFAKYDNPGGCEDPRIAMTADGLYVMAYTSWNRKVPRLSIATSRDLKHWTKHGPAFLKAYGGKFKDMASKSASIVTKVENGRQVIAKVNGKYFMYWGEHWIAAATSDDLVNWTPVVDERQELHKIVKPRRYFFDSDLTECGPPAVMTRHGIVLLYNGKNNKGAYRDKRYPAGAYCAGQLLFDSSDPLKVLGRLDRPFFQPERQFEKSGQYVDGTVFVEGLVYFKQKWFLYYGCADSHVGVAVWPTSTNYSN